ncbi:hypothetical protein M569_12330 [Genlisea aurea]|uniref:TF-B3 domain-containing protein n=1 Tax=Genlisea aurea TaxID=192259 RepID=S8DI71_9LAMI|nr:hypothetical protein M569_12330 [Genlisea aurea]
MAGEKEDKEEGAKKPAGEQPRRNILVLPFRKADELSKVLQRNDPEEEEDDGDEEEEEEEEDDDDEDDDDDDMILLVSPPNRINLARDKRVMVKTLEPRAVTPYSAQLHLSDFEASMLTVHDSPISVSSPFAKPIIVFDCFRRQYDLILIGEVREDDMGFFLGGDWCRFVADHRLKAGDVVEFYDLGDDPDNCLIQLAVRYFRKPHDRK